MHKKSPRKPAQKPPQKNPSAMQRLEVVENRHNVLVARIQKAFDAMEQRTNALEKVVAALMEMLGNEEVNDKILEQHHRAQEEKADGVQENIDKAIEAGQMKVAEVADTEDTLIVSQEANKEGVILHPSRIFITLGGYAEQPDIQKLMKGKKKDDKFEAGDEGHTITILGLYHPIPEADWPKEEEVEAKAPEEAPEATPEKTEETPAPVEA